MRNLIERLEVRRLLTAQIEFVKSDATANNDATADYQTSTLSVVDVVMAS